LIALRPRRCRRDAANNRAVYQFFDSLLDFAPATWHTGMCACAHVPVMSDPEGLTPTPRASAPAIPAPPATPVPGAVPPRERLRRPGIALLAGGAGVLILLLLWAHSYNRINGLQAALVRELAQANDFGKESRALAGQAQQSVRDLDFKLGMLESRLSETQNQRLALEALYLELSRSRDERVLAEVEQILLAGSQQLQLAGNLKAALIALESADSRLQRADSAQFTGLRRAIARDVERLKSAPFVDVVGMSVRLDTLAHQVDGMALAMYERPVEPAAPAAPPRDSVMVRFAREAWQDLRDLIRIQRVESEEVPLVAPSQQFFLRENLRLRLLSARIALLARDETSFRADLRSSQDWLKRYFDARDKQVGGALTALKQLSDMQVSIELPSALESVDAVRNQKLVRERGLR
jgi:uroporphyrin-3 C-methyltransferase